MALAWPQNFKRGTFNLGRASRPVGFVSCLWIGFITIAFCLPTVNPVTSQTLNYTGVAVGIVGFGSLGSWLAWARRWFTGRCRDHCRVCIEQLDFLADYMMDRSNTPEFVAESYPLEQRDSNRQLHDFDQ